MFFYNGSVALVKDDLATHLDYLTEATILSEAIYDGNESPFVKLPPFIPSFHQREMKIGLIES